MHSVLIQASVEDWCKHNFQKDRRFEIIEKIKNFVDEKEFILDKQIKKIDSTNRLYKLRINKADRLVFSVDGYGEQKTIRIHTIGNHKLGEKSHMEQRIQQYVSQSDVTFKSLSLDNVEIEPYKNDLIQKKMYEPNLYYAWNDYDLERIKNNPKAKLWWYLDDEQASVAKMRGPVVLKGSAGSGKTTIALYRLMGWKNHRPQTQSLYLTYSEKLKNNSKDLYASLSCQSSGVEFQTIEEFLLSFVVNRKEIIDFNDFKTIINEDLKNRRNKTIDKTTNEQLWEEFRGVLKGCVYLSIVGKPFLEESEYLNLRSVNLTEEDSLFSIDQRKDIYHFFELYQRELGKLDKWDDLDLAYNALKSNKFSKYDQVIVDEIQDIPSLHLQAILKCVEDPQGLFLTGDANQAIHPSRFLWSRLNDQIYNYLGRGKTKLNYRNKEQVIHLNYRCSLEVLELLNNLSLWRSDVLEEEKLKLENIFQSNQPLIYVDSNINKSLYDLSEMAVSIMIIVPNEEIKKNVMESESGIFKNLKINVFTIHESKGLECEYVILYAFFEEYKIYSELKQRGQHFLKRNLHQIRYVTNLFNVACSRARKSIVFLDTVLPEWKPLSSVKSLNTVQTQQLLDKLIYLRSDLEDKIQRAKELEANKNWEQAAELWKQVNVMVGYHRCVGYIERQNNAFFEAGLHFQEAKEFTSAYQCFEKSDHFNEMFEVLLQHPEPAYANPLIQEFFEDTKKIGNLKPNFFREIANKVKDPESSLSLLVLFKYYEHKLKFYDKDILSEVLFLAEEWKDLDWGSDGSFDLLKNIGGVLNDY